MKRSRILAALMICFGIASCTAPEQSLTVQDREKIRAFVLKQLSDDQIREKYAEAKREFEAERLRMMRQWRENQEREAAVLEERSRRCKDAAYRVKNKSDCAVNLADYYMRREQLTDATIEFYLGTVEGQFQKKLLGECAYVQTIKEAKRVKCLPE